MRQVLIRTYSNS